MSVLGLVASKRAKKWFKSFASEASALMVTERLL
jgi:hypothetical protein